MAKSTIKQLDKYKLELCCEDCSWANNIRTDYDNGCCPECGGKLIKVVGRWRISEMYYWHRWFTNFGLPTIIVHEFVRGREK